MAGLRKYCFTFWKWITLLATNHHLSPGKRKWGQSMFLYPFLNLFLVLELSMSWHISVVEIEDDVIKRMPVAMTGIGSVRRKGQILILPVGFKY